MSQKAIDSEASPESLPLSTSLKPLDQALGGGEKGGRGGLHRGSITEFVGPPGAGKTQFCLTLTAAVLTQTFGNEVDYDDKGIVKDENAGIDHSRTRLSKVAYVDTEGAFSPTRLFEILEKKFSDKLGIPSGHDLADDWKERVGERVMVYAAPTCAKLLAVLDKLDADIVLNK